MVGIAEQRAVLGRFLASLAPGSSSAPGEASVFREHIFSSIWGGVSAGIFILTDVILAKALNAPGWQITLLASLSPAANIFSVDFAGQVTGRRKAGPFLLAAILGRLTMGLLLVWRTSMAMILLTFIYNIAGALVVTALNSVLQSRYPEPVRPVRFGVATSVSALFTILAAVAAGRLLELREGVYPWLFFGCGIAGFLSVYHYYRMECPPGERRGMIAWLSVGLAGLRRRLAPAAGDAARHSLAASLRVAARIFRENPDFVRFERDYMIYGFAFMSLLPILPIYIVRELNMNYAQLSASKGLWAQLGAVVLSPILGAALSRLRPLRFTGRVFLALSLYPLLLFVSTWRVFPVPTRILWVYGALLAFSVAMAGVNLSWTLGSMHFARGRDASAFQGMHVAMTGVRGLLAPSLGYAVYKLIGTGAVFVMATGLFAAAGILMLRHDREERAASP
jgi:MFS family permease